MAGNATRESVSKNALVIAREAVKRSPEHKDIIRKFVQNFEQRVGQPDNRFGFRKYKALLRRAVNRHMDTVHIDLNDLEEFIRAQIQTSDSQMNIQAQDSLERLLTDLESDTLRYMKYFYEACDAEQPDKDDDFNMENAALAKDAINRWRARNWADNAGADGASGQAPSVPPRMKNDW